MHLASLTWNGTRELVFRIRDPEPAHAYLTTLTADPTPPRHFSYRIDEDAAWRLAESFLRPGRLVGGSPDA